MRRLLNDPKGSRWYTGDCTSPLMGYAGAAKEPMKPCTAGTSTNLVRMEETLASSPDKNTSESLRNLRWEIYELLERYDGDYGKCIRMTLQQGVEELFKKYTDS